MNSVKNKVQLIGNLGAAPEMRSTESGRKMARLRLATNETYRNAQGEKVTETQWHTVIAWGQTAEIAEKFLRKGSEVLIEGKLQYRQYADKDGVVKYITEIQAFSLLMLGEPVKEITTESKSALAF